MRYIEKNSAEYRRAIAVLFLGSMAAFGAEYCLQPVIPVIATEFGLTPAKASLVMSFGTAGMAFSMILIACFAKFLQRKVTMGIALVVASALTIAMALSENFTLILVMRLLQGILLAGFPALAIAYVHEEFDHNIIGFVMGIYVSGTALGGLAGRLMMSVLTDFSSWREALFVAGVLYLFIGIAFTAALPKPQHPMYVGERKLHFFGDMKRLLSNRQLTGIYFITFGVMGAFVCTYNYISYTLMAPPYNLSQTIIGMIFSVYLVGMVSSTVMGKISDKYGNGKILCLSILLMLIGIWISAAMSIIFKVAGLAVFTYGFFAAHTTACGWAEKVSQADKAQISSVYMLFYYVGASVLGTVGGIFLAQYGWNGVVIFVSSIIIVVLYIAYRLLRREVGLNQ